jgi:hypothetical protein
VSTDRTTTMVNKKMKILLFPVTMMEKIYAEANEPKRLVLLEGLAHGDLVDGKAGEYLAPVVEHVYRFWFSTCYNPIDFSKGCSGLPG